MGYKHSKEEILAAALEAALEEGLSQLTFGRLARKIEISDRTIVYYFPKKDDLIAAVLLAMGLELQALVESAFSSKAADHRELARFAWPILASEDVDPVFALFFEATGLASAGRTPYVEVVPALIEAWITWASQFVEGPARRRRSEAEAAIAIIDGLLLMRLTAGAEASDRAARTLGVAPRG